MKRVILDCDNTLGLPFKEIDDGLALLYLLGRPDIELLGITTVFGNGTTEQAYEQTKNLLRKVNREDIPVFLGQPEPGDHFVNEAAKFLAKTAKSAPGEVSILATGPLTNLAAASRLDGHFFVYLREIVCMGGYLDTLRIGWRHLKELNLSADPRAAYIILNAPCEVTLMSAQLCLQAPFSWADLKEIRGLDPWLQNVIRNWLLAFGLYFAVPRFYLWDLVPAVYLSFPELFDRCEVQFTSSVSDLASGWISYHAAQGANKKLPANLLDSLRFNQIVYEGWKVSGSAMR